MGLSVHGGQTKLVTKTKPCSLISVLVSLITCHETMQLQSEPLGSLLPHSIDLVSSLSREGRHKSFRSNNGTTSLTILRCTLKIVSIVSSKSNFSQIYPKIFSLCRYCFENLKQNVDNNDSKNDNECPWIRRSE